ncbi:MAG: YicC family protein [Acidobacteria bacterium]|nr:YicC family protein [Acidobacteriota bacterium]
MIKSMTGFASVTHDDQRGSIGLTIRAVNHRFLDLQLRLSPTVADLESRVRALVQKRLSRGRVEITVVVQLRQLPTPHVELNEALVQALIGALDGARSRGLVEGSLTPGDLLRLPQALVIRERAAESELAGDELRPAIEATLDQALDQLEAMRVLEGAHLAADLDARKADLSGLIERLATAADEGRAALEGRLSERVRDLMSAVPGDAAAVAQEIVRVAQRSDISEEVTRFRGHLAHWAALTTGPEPCGRKLDFLLQEMNREVNTIASKADGLQVSELVIQAKAELERLREQVQNVE